MENYSKINIKIFRGMAGQIPFDVYIRLSNIKFMQIFKRGDPVDLDRLQNYQKKGVNTLYITKKERREYILTIEQQIYKALQNKALNNPEVTKVVEELTEQTLYEIFEDRLFDGMTLRRCQSIVKTYVALLGSDTRSLTNFITMAKNESYICRHSIATAVMSILLAKALGQNNDKTLQIIGLGALLHDIGITKLAPNLWDAEYRLNLTGGHEIKEHPAAGGQLVKTVPQFPAEVAMVIEQHHEHWDGSGYPFGLKGEEIYFPARIVGIADAFSNLTTRRDGRHVYAPEEAMELLYLRAEEYDFKMLAALDSMVRPRRTTKTWV